MHIKIENQLNISNINKFSLKGDHYSQFTPCKTYECVPLAYCDFIYILNTNSVKNVFIFLFFMNLA